MGRSRLVARLICVAVAACVVVPLGQTAVPAEVIGTLAFNATEAVLTTTLGFVLYAALFG